MPANDLLWLARQRAAQTRGHLRELAHLAREFGNVEAASTITAAADDVHRITEDALRAALPLIEGPHARRVAEAVAETLSDRP